MGKLKKENYNKPFNFKKFREQDFKYPHLVICLTCERSLERVEYLYKCVKCEKHHCEEHSISVNMPSDKKVSQSAPKGYEEVELFIDTTKGCKNCVFKWFEGDGVGKQLKERNIVIDFEGVEQNTNKNI